MFTKEIKDNKTEYKITDLGIKVLKAFISVCLMTCLVVGLCASSVVEASPIPVIAFSVSEEEVAKAKAESAEKADIIMTAADFLAPSERAADYEDIHEYVLSLKENGIDESKKNDTLAEDEAISEDASDEESKNNNKNAVDSKESTDSDKESKEENADSQKAESSETEKSEASENVAVDTDDWRLILVNKQNPVPDGYEATLGNINGSLQADERIIDDVYDMLEAANRDGVDLMICSAYRSYERQTELFNNKMNKLMNKGMSYMEAYSVGSMSVTVPGTSEHQLGLALDILTGNYTSMDDGFGDTAAGKWLKENAPDYGFILRYPEGKEEITGIIYEPWHFRYVGRQYSRDITESGLCLEEYLGVTK